jgi:hypothetical protein
MYTKYIIPSYDPPATAGCANRVQSMPLQAVLHPELCVRVCIVCEYEVSITSIHS